VTPEQDELVATVRAVLTKLADSQAVRAAIASPTGYDEELWRVLTEQVGVAALAIPEEYDGAGATLVEACLVLEEIGRSLAPAPMLSSLITSQCLLGADPMGAGPMGAGATELLPHIAAGEVASLLLTKRLVSCDMHAARGSTTGAHPWALDGDVATILLADVDGALVQLDPDTVRRSTLPTLDQTLRLATVDVTGATTTELAANAGPALEHARLVALVGIAALQAGTARRGLEMTVAHSKERVQFGRPIGSFQALKHRMADLLVLVEMSRSAYLAAAEALSGSRGAGRVDHAAELAAVAKSYCGEALQQVASETIQLHGGIAITWEHDAHLVLKRAHALNQLFGPPHQHRAGIAL